MSGQVSTSRQAKLFDSLYEKTIEGKVEWQVVKEKTYETALKSGSIRFYPSGADYVIAVYNANGDMVDRFADTQLFGQDPGKPFESYYTKMGDLIGVIERKISGADDLLDDLISELG